jgi:serine/threonine protein kinase
LAFKARKAAVDTFMAGNDMPWDFEVGMYDLVLRLNQMEEETRLHPETARHLADKATRYTARLRTQLSDGELTPVQSLNNCRIRTMAPLEYEEVTLGPLLGAGGFSTVFAVDGFHLKDHSTPDYDSDERAAREFLNKHARRYAGNGGPTIHRSVEGTKSNQTTARYAVKHLRRGLAEEADRFERAAVDLVMEAQLLLALDHPNIISIRGWSRQGPGGYVNGKHTDFFVILDRLPETLEDKIYAWRKKLKRYKAMGKLPWGRKKYIAKTSALLLKRMQAALDIAASLEYMHDRRIINRDVKASNIGFDIHGELKMFDFGLSRLLPAEEERVEGGFVMSRVGTKYYMAPEVCDKQPFDLSADVYSFGVVLWELLTLSTPREVIRKLRRLTNSSYILPICPCWPKALQRLVGLCLADDPSVRPTMAVVRASIEIMLERLGVPRAVGGKARRRSTFRLETTATDSIANAALTVQSFSDYDPSIPTSVQCN